MRTVLVAVLVFASLPALANPPSQTPIEAPEPRLESYRWQIVAADLASIGLLVAGGEDTAKPALGMYLLGAPLVHAFHGNAGRAAGSLALRVGLPLVLGLGGAWLDEGNQSSECKAGDELACDEGVGDLAAIGIATGILAAMIVDGVVIAKPERRPTWSPVITTARNGAAVGFSARF